MNTNPYSDKSMESIHSSKTQVGFLRALFDFKFQHFIYIRVASVIYAILIVVILLACAFLVLASLYGLISSNVNSATAFALLLASPLAAILSIILLRLTFESGIALVAIAENTKKN